MGEAAGAPGVNAGMVLASLKYGDPTRDAFAARASAYVVPDILWSSYYDATGVIPVAEDFKVRLSGQVMVRGSTGANLLTGHQGRGPARRDLPGQCRLRRQHGQSD